MSVDGCCCCSSPRGKWPKIGTRILLISFFFCYLVEICNIHDVPSKKERPFDLFFSFCALLSIPAPENWSEIGFKHALHFLSSFDSTTFLARLSKEKRGWPPEKRKTVIRRKPFKWSVGSCVFSFLSIGASLELGLPAIFQFAVFPFFCGRHLQASRPAIVNQLATIMARCHFQF